jgi:signal transduction histidine kinase
LSITRLVSADVDASAKGMPAPPGAGIARRTGVAARITQNMKLMDGTNQTTGGSPINVGGKPAARLRLVRLLLTAFVGSAVVIWMSRTTWERVESLEQTFSQLNADRFYLGVRARSDIVRLNETLLRYRLRGDTNEAAAFRSDALKFKEWLQSSSTNAADDLERSFCKDVREAYAEYLLESKPLLEADSAWWQTKNHNFTVSYEKVQADSSYLLGRCDKFIDDQRSHFSAFLEETNRTLAGFQRLLRISVTLLLLLAATLVILVYRGMIAPLRHQLSESQAIIARQEKLASLGVLAAGVAHEIRNPLTAIKFRLFSLKNCLPPEGNEDAGVIASEINRLERIVRDFLQFARPSEPQMVVLPAQRIAQEAYDLLKPQMEKSGIRLDLERTGEAWIKGDLQQLKQVLINLVQNAADSTHRDGHIILRVRRDSGSARRRGKPGVLLEVIDNGKGIPPEVQKRLFDPFFTTKEGGTGLGLPIAARIIEKHGGELRYQTEVERGTTFTILLPEVGEHEA